MDAVIRDEAFDLIIFVFLKNTKTNFVQIFRFVFKSKIAVLHPLRPRITLTQKTDLHPVRNTDQEPQYGPSVSSCTASRLCVSAGTVLTAPKKESDAGSGPAAGLAGNDTELFGPGPEQQQHRSRHG